MPGSCCRIAKACRTESIRRRRSRSLLKGSGGVSLRGFSQTCRDLVRDPGALFSPKPIIFPQSHTVRRQLHEGNAGRLPGISQTKAAAGTSLTSRASAAKTASPRLAGWKRFEQRLGHLCGPIDGVSIAVNPRNDEAPCTTLMSISPARWRRVVSQFRRRLGLRRELRLGRFDTIFNSATRELTTSDASRRHTSCYISNNPNAEARMRGIPRRFDYFVYGVIQSGLTCAIAAAIASFPFIATGTFVIHWLRSSFVAWIMMLPIVLFAAPAIRRLTNLLTRED